MLDPDQPDAPPKSYGFKPKEFERVNAPAAGGEPLPLTAKGLAMLAGGPGTKAPRPGQPAPAPAKPGDPNDVFTLLRENRRTEQRHGLGEIGIRKRKSRRRRDYWLLLAGGNIVIIGGTFLLGLNVMTVASGSAGVIIFSFGLTWIMWQIMEDY